MAEQIVRCSDGHLFTANQVPMLSIRSLRLGGGKRLEKCPVDGEWRKTEPVDSNELTESQVKEAHAHTVGLQ